MASDRKKPYRRGAGKSITKGKNNPSQNEERKVASKASDARKAALMVVRHIREHSAFAQEVIAQTLDKVTLSPSDRAFATRLVLGVVSSEGTLDEVIDRCLRSPDDVKPDVRDALRISAYEMLFLEKDSYAAVDQGVELVKFITIKATGLANSVLRKIANVSKQFPFGDPANDLAACARMHAFPLWLAEYLVKELGSEAARDFMAASNEPAPLYIAINTLKTDEKEVRSAFSEYGENIESVSFGERVVEGCYRVKNARVLQSPHIKELFLDGKLLVSDASSQYVAQQILPDNYPESFLEVGSGRGTKTILLQTEAQRKYGKQLHLIALDQHNFKKDLLEKRASLYGVLLQEAYTHDARNLKTLFEKREFSVVFIDAPCSGLGTLRRHPEIRWRLTPEKIKSVAKTGFEMLEEASKYVAFKGMLSYATCTITREENESLIKRFLESAEGKRFKLISINETVALRTRLFPGSPDAHFAVRMVRVR